MGVSAHRVDGAAADVGMTLRRLPVIQKNIEGRVQFPPESEPQRRDGLGDSMAVRRLLSLITHPTCRREYQLRGRLSCGHR